MSHIKYEIKLLILYRLKMNNIYTIRPRLWCGGLFGVVFVYWSYNFIGHDKDIVFV